MLRPIGRPSRHLQVKPGHVFTQRAFSISRSNETPHETSLSASPDGLHKPFSTINSAEIAHFSRLSSLWWDTRGEFSFLHKMNPVRMKFIHDRVREARWDDTSSASQAILDEDIPALQGLDVLDVGCGGGLVSESLARSGARSTLGIDASRENVAIAEVHAAQDPSLSFRKYDATNAASERTGLTYRNTPAELLLQEQKRFDVVCALEVVEHVDNPSQFLATCAELVKPGGHLFISTIARNPLAYALTIFAVEDLLRLVTPGTHTYSKYINPQELIEYFSNPLSPVSSHNQNPSPSRPWISSNGSLSAPLRTEAQVRGMIYVPWAGKWELAPPSMGELGNAVNYILWVRKPHSA